MYSRPPRQEIIKRIVHLNELHRRVIPLNDRARVAYERREVSARTILSNLPRNKDHPTLVTLLEVMRSFSLTLEGAHRVFGYDLPRFTDVDIEINGGHTHVLENYGFARDQLVDIPLELASESKFQGNHFLKDLVLRWQAPLPIRNLEARTWRKPKAFHVHIGTEDSLGSSLPPGSTALVEPIESVEEHQPSPRSIYCLQFKNGYCCSQCLVVRDKLHLLVAQQQYPGPQYFDYPGEVRIVGRVRSYALRLPQAEYPDLCLLPANRQSAALTLPWEHVARHTLFATEHQRYERSLEENRRIRARLREVLQTHLSARTERRYRRPSPSQPHVNALLYLSLVHLTPYTDALHTGVSGISDRGRFSLETLLKIQYFADLPGRFERTAVPYPADVWESKRQEFMEWPAMLSLQPFGIKAWEKKIIRVGNSRELGSLDPPIKDGSWLTVEPLSHLPEPTTASQLTGWSRPLYVLQRGKKLLCGYLERDSDRYLLLSHRGQTLSGSPVSQGDIGALFRVSAIVATV